MRVKSAVDGLMGFAAKFAILENHGTVSFMWR
jgi:hypothetical protein